MDVPGFALVTGAGSGIGLACAMVYAKEGSAGVCLADISPEALQKAAEQVQSVATNPEFKAISVVVDVRSEESINNLVSETIKAFGRLDYAANCAGVSFKPGHGHEGGWSMTNYDFVTDINFRGVFLCTKAEIAAMKTQEPRANPRRPDKKQRGSIVNIASMSGLVGLKNSAAYAASKHAVVGLSKNAAIDHAEDLIRCNAVCPGYIYTALTQNDTIRAKAEKLSADKPMGRLGEPEEIGDAVVFLSGGRASFVTGTAFSVDGGYTAV
ncbi:hypothetical protein YB2330_002141 [Saitoella coloradoensis]